METLSAIQSPCCMLEFPRSTTTTLHKSSFLCAQPLKSSGFKRYPHITRSYSRHYFRVHASAAGSIQESGQASIKSIESNGDDLVFVAGATGRVGSRTVRELIKFGFRVRAGVRSKQRAQFLVESVEKLEIASTDATNSTSAVQKLELVECDLEKPGEIAPAIGNASVVICCVGASENEIFDVSGPYRIDYQATKNLIDVAAVSKVKHFILLTSLGTNKVGFPAALLNLFWGVLLWKRKAEEALIASGIPYTIVRPGGMERPTDEFKLTHNVVLASAETYFGGLVSNLQVAELLAFIAKSKSLSFNKVVEVIAETTAPLLPFEELLSKIPPDIEPQSEPKLEPPPTISEARSAAQKKPIEVKKTSSLSPYPAYDDLKPPTSPSPSSGFISPEPQPGAGTSESLPVHTVDQVVPTRPLSPYSAYDDLKPPTSPTPSSGFIRSEPQRGPDVSKSEPVYTIDKVVQTRPLSPYSAYEDFKPPTSPSPNAPIVPAAKNSVMEDGSLSPSSSSQPVEAISNANDAPHGARWPFTVTQSESLSKCNVGHPICNSISFSIAKTNLHIPPSPQYFSCTINQFLIVCGI